MEYYFEEPTHTGIKRCNLSFRNNAGRIYQIRRKQYGMGAQRSRLSGRRLRTEPDQPHIDGPIWCFQLLYDTPIDKDQRLIKRD